MLQWFDIDKDWGEVRKSIMFLPKKEDKRCIYQNGKVQYCYVLIYQELQPQETKLLSLTNVIPFKTNSQYSLKLTESSNLIYQTERFTSSHFILANTGRNHISIPLIWWGKWNCQLVEQQQSLDPFFSFQFAAGLLTSNL